MSEHPKHSMVEPAEVIRLAIASLGEQVNGMTQAEAELSITERTLYYDRILSDHSVPFRAMSAARIACQIVSKQYDDKCKRYVIEFAPLSGDHAGEVEKIRSDRTDSMVGPSVVKLWEPVKAGDFATIFKLNDAPRESDKKVGPKGYRVAPYISVWNTGSGSEEDENN